MMCHPVRPRPGDIARTAYLTRLAIAVTNGAPDDVAILVERYVTQAQPTSQATFLAWIGRRLT